MKQYYICKPGRTQEGPYPENMVRTCYEQGVFPADTLIWYEGASEWMPIQSIFVATQAEPAPAVPPPFQDPPPPQEEAVYYVTHPGMQPQGPYTRTAVITGYYQGAYPPGTMIWGPDTGTWIPIENLLGSALHSGVKSVVGHFQGRANAKSWNPITAFTSCMKRYAQFRGRASRAEYWYFRLAHFLIVLVPGLIAAVLTGEQYVVKIVVAIATLPFLLPLLAVQARRLHDRKLSAWWLLLCLLSYIGAIILMIISCLPSKNESNPHGSAPLPPA